MSEQKQERVMAGKTTKKAKGGGAGSGEDDDDAPKSKKKLPLIIGAVVLVLALAGGAWFMFLKPSGASAAEEKPTPGAVVVLDPISVNLADNHYLRLGMSLQLTDTADAKTDGSKALDLAIATFTGQDKAKLADTAEREKLRAELQHKLDEAYEKKVMAVYFTQFVTQ